MEALHYVEEIGALGEPLVVLGDNELTINFTNRKFIPGKRELVTRVKEAMEISCNSGDARGSLRCNSSIKTAPRMNGPIGWEG